MTQYSLGKIDLDGIDESPRYGYSSQEIGSLKKTAIRCRRKEQELGAWNEQWILAILTKRGLVDYYLDKLRWFKTASNDLPKQLVHGHYKCRCNYIVGVKADIKTALHERIVFDKSVRDKIEEFFTHKFAYSRAKRTTPQEIVFINEVLDSVIRNLEKMTDTK